MKLSRRIFMEPAALRSLCSVRNLAAFFGRVAAMFANDPPTQRSSQVYAVLSLIIVAIVGLLFLQPVAVVSYERDIWHHLSVYRELIASPFHPENPHIAGNDPSRSFTPWTVAIALICKTLALDQFGAITLSAIGSTALILSGVFHFSRQYWQQQSAPFVFLLSLLGTWMVQVDHAGFLTIRTSLFSIAYPYASVIGMGFHCWAFALRAIHSGSQTFAYAALLGVFAYVMFVSHQLQALFAIGMTGAFLLFTAGKATVIARVICCTALVGGGIATAGWWYLNPIAYVLNEQVHAGHAAVRYLEYSLEEPGEILMTLGLALLGVLGFVDYKSRRLRLEILVPAAVLIACFIFLLAGNNWVSVRILPTVAMVLQIGLTAFLMERMDSTAAIVTKNAIAFALILGTIGALVTGVNQYFRARNYLQSGAVVDRIPLTWSSSILQASAYAEKLVPPGSVVLAHRQTSFPMEASSLSVVAIPRLFAEVPTMASRQSDNRKFFEPGTSTQTRCAIIERYSVSLIVWRRVWIDEKAVPSLLSLGPAKRFDDLTFIPAESGRFSGCA